MYFPVNESDHNVCRFVGRVKLCRVGCYGDMTLLPVSQTAGSAAAVPTAEVYDYVEMNIRPKVNDTRKPVTKLG